MPMAAGAFAECKPAFDQNLISTHTHVHTLSMDNPKKPDLKRKLVVVGDGSSAPYSIMAKWLNVWDAKVAVERPVF